MVGLVGPAEPDVVYLLHRKAFGQVLGEEVRVARPREGRVERDDPSGPVIGVVVVAVLEEHRRNGVARKLAERIILEAIKSNCISVFLLVSEDNAPAISLYDSLGFVSKGKSDKVLDGKPIIIMEKLLVNCTSNIVGSPYEILYP